MFVTKELLEKVLSDARCGAEDKIYTSYPEVIIFLAQMGGEVRNGHQIGGKWLTEVRFGDMVFVHSSENQIIKEKAVPVVYQ